MHTFNFSGVYIINGKKIRLSKTAEIATRWIGSYSSVVVHTFFFIISFTASLFGFIRFDSMLLILTTIVSLEAIYLSIFIQMSINKNNEVIEIIQEDVGEIQEDIDEIQKDVDEIQDDSQNDEATQNKEGEALKNIQAILLNLQKEIEILKKR